MSAEPKGPLWLPTWQVERMMRDCRAAKEAGKAKCEIDTASLEGLLHDSLLWRQERITQQGKPCICPPNGASYACPTHGVLNGKAVSMSKSNDELIARLEKIHASLAAMSIGAGYGEMFFEVTKALELVRAEPPRAPPGTFEIGLTSDETEVIMNMPHTPDNGTGFVHFAFTPLQAIAAGELLIKKGHEAAPKAGMQAARAAVREMHTHVWEADPVSGAAVCKCGTHADAWFCPTSPDKFCHYERGMFDSCIHCGHPEERK